MISVLIINLKHREKLITVKHLFGVWGEGLCFLFFRGKKMLVYTPNSKVFIVIKIGMVMGEKDRWKFF